MPGFSSLGAASGWLSVYLWYFISCIPLSYVLIPQHCRYMQGISILRRPDVQVLWAGEALLTQTQLPTLPCAKGRADPCHDLILLEVFEVGEAEEALESLRKTQQRSPPCPLTLPREPLRVNLLDDSDSITYSKLYQALAQGIPLIVSGIRPGSRNLTPQYFIHNHGDTPVMLTNTKTGSKRKVALKLFMEDFVSPSDSANPEKLQDWPPTADFAVKYPEIFELFEDCLVGPWITSRRGPLNLENNMPADSCPPDTGPKAYLAHGAAGGTTTRLHTDMTDAVNIQFHAEGGPEGGALWTMIDRDDMSRAAELLRQSKRGLFGEGHPIHSQQLNLTDKDVQDLRDGEVTNWTSCIKIAVDFPLPANVGYSRRISEELRQHRLDCGDTDAEDVLQLSAMCWWTYKRWKIENLADTRSDPNSNPWYSTYSAAPAYMPVPLVIPNRQSSSSPKEPVPLVSPNHQSSPSPNEPVPLVSPNHRAASPPGIEDENSSSFQAIPICNSGVADKLLGDASSTIPQKELSSHPDVEDSPSEVSLIPSKRQKPEGQLTRTQKRRLKKARSIHNRSLADEGKILNCPLGGCTRSADEFDRWSLLNHLESVHHLRVRFLHLGQSGAETVEKRRKILEMHPNDDMAFKQYIQNEVLNMGEG
ncbi:unnamed protein product [Peniophora sp. CBMAI 1063]|nr:unnamed protein product [Peniophora sp. CBMAI 1063]